MLTGLQLGMHSPELYEYTTVYLHQQPGFGMSAKLGTTKNTSRQSQRILIQLENELEV